MIRATRSREKMIRDRAAGGTALYGEAARRRSPAEPPWADSLQVSASPNASKVARAKRDCAFVEGELERRLGLNGSAAPRPS